MARLFCGVGIMCWSKVILGLEVRAHEPLRSWRQLSALTYTLISVYTTVVSLMPET
jgi:hypothetical protein